MTDDFTYPPADFTADPDTRLMMAFAAGEDAAFELIVKRFERQVFGIVCRYMGNRPLAEDTAQEVFLRVYRLRKSYRPTARISTLIYRITANLCLNVIRDESRRRMVSLDAVASDDELSLGASIGSTAAPAEDAVEARERAEIVRRALAKIPERQRIALILHRFEGLSYAEIAESMETNIDAVKSLLSRARASLAEALRPDIEAGNL